jgi:para-aminobenzoate synthetase/4-amino-4-deoxychorismate lyase
VLFDHFSQRWLAFQNPVSVLVARTAADVLATLRAVETETERGFWAAGFVTYEAASAFDPALVTHDDASGLPLLWFGIYEAPVPVAAPPQVGQGVPIDWVASVSVAEYNAGFAQIKNHIAVGDTYQVNFTFRLRAPFAGDAWELFSRAAHAQGSGYPVFVETDEWVIGSASPELFFTLEGEKLVSKPMKGTAPRGLWLEDDQAKADWLYHSGKNRAENVMIVDMVRNDLGRIARVGSVRVPKLFEVEKYRTVWQMTSTVECETPASLTEIFAALFPAASITGAPKSRTMQIIRELENSPRRIYTGTLGYIAPHRRAQFNVAIRTFLLEKRSGRVEYGLGGGIVWDSEQRDEMQEAYTKAKILTETPPDFSLLETLLWTPEGGFALLERHLERLKESAAYFDFPFDEVEIREKFSRIRAETPQRVRLLLDAEGGISLERSALNPLPAPYRVKVAEQPVASNHALLYHKTTHRAVYEAARLPDCDDVLLWNERGELTESTIANLVVEKAGQLLTPPVECGLLPGTARAQWLAEGRLREAVLRVEELAECDKIFLLNSVRGMWEIGKTELIPSYRRG